MRKAISGRKRKGRSRRKAALKARRRLKTIKPLFDQLLDITDEEVSDWQPEEEKQQRNPFLGKEVIFVEPEEEEKFEEEVEEMPRLIIKTVKLKKPPKATFLFLFNFLARQPFLSVLLASAPSCV